MNLEILIFTLSTDNFPSDLWDKGLKLLPGPIRERVERFKKEDDRRSRLCSFLLLRKVYQLLGEEYDPLPKIALGHKGRPYIPGAPDFNWSHSGSLVVLAASSSARVGVDIEKKRTVRLQHFERYFSRSDWACIEGAADPHREFLETWTRTEALLKADGRGVFAARPELSLRQSPVQLDGVRWHLFPLDLFDGYVGTLATDDASARLKIFNYDIELLQQS